ncbi:hypothetical protein BDD12DRAFT_940572 [Trichophaea hybrida]|nr:hypothetical protein BDD12DRAFT_940572 [Trichophaea hybrida]
MVDSDLNVTGYAQEHLLEQLREGSNFLENHAKDVEDIWKKYKPTVFSFYGTSTTDMCMNDGWSELINRAFHHIHPPPPLATDTFRFPIQENYTDMVKFSSVDDSNYHTVLERLRNMMKEITKSTLTPTRRMHGILRYYGRGDTKIPGPGYSITSLSKPGDKMTAPPHFGFMGFEVVARPTLLSNLLAQLLKQTPEMIVHFAAESEYAMQKEKTSWTFEMLWRVFERIMNDDTIKGCFLIIDALDECEEQSRTKLLSRLRRLLLCDRPTGPRIKLIITSRSHTPIASHFTDVVRLSLDSNFDEIKSDIAEFVETSVRRLRTSTAGSNLGDEIVEAVTRGAPGMFLWVSLVVEELLASTFTAPRDIRKTLNTLPANLGEVYTDILRRVSSDNRPTVKEILRWVAFAQRPLTLQELSIAIAVRPEDTSMASIADKMETDLRKVVSRLLGPIIEIRSDDTVHFVHFSVKEFLMGMNDWSEGHAYRDELSPFLLSYTYSHSRIALACLTYLAFEEFEEESKAVLFEQDSCHRHIVEDQCRKNQFLGYAAYYWFEHAKQTPEGSNEYEACYRAFLRLGEYAGKMDLAYLVFTSLHNRTFVSTTPLHFVASLGFSSFTHKLLSHKDKIDAQVALSLGDDETFGALSKFDYYSIGLVLCELEMGWEYDEGKGGLDMGGKAIGDKRMGGESIARLFVEKVAPNNTKRDIYGYALHAAAWNGREDMVKWLVGKDVDINAERGICGTALHIAAASGQEKVAQILLDAGAAVQDDIDTPRNSCVRDTVTRIIRQVPSDTLTLGTNFASALRITGLWKEAAMVLERIVQKSTSLLGPEHSNTLSSMTILAHTYADLGRMEAAFDLLQKVFDIRTLTLGKDHPDTKYSRECLCSCVTGSVHWQDVEGEYKVRLWLAMNHSRDG